MQPTRTNRSTAAVALLMFVFALPAALCCGETATWNQGADIDAWAYSNTSGSGYRDRGPTFGGAFVDDETQQFQYGSDDGASRLGMSIMAFETQGQIEAGYAPSRYGVTSVTFTAMARKAGPTATPLIYSNQPLTQTQLLYETIAGNNNSPRPMELFGVGFREGYEGFDLGLASGELLFSEDSEAYGGEGQSYVTYPIIFDSEGNQVDVSNSYTGGFSATEPSEFTAPFSATPWSIGTTAAVAVGAALPNNTRFTFQLDLAQPGVLSYVQQSLADGAIGFMLSSMHSAGQEGVGGSAYPDWWLREAGVMAAYASLSIEYELLSLLGDYDSNGAVEQADYVAWSQAYGSNVAAGTGADGNGDGFVDAADYSVWRDAFIGTPLLAVPEPTACLILAAALVTNLSLPRRVLAR
jgi:hypothetical protein